MKINQDYKNAALDALRGRWAAAVLCTVVLMIVVYVFAASSTYGDLASLGAATLDFANPLFLSGFGAILLLFLYMPLSVGFANTFKKLYINGDTDCVYNLFWETFRGYVRNIWGSFLMYFFTFLWTLLFVIPGIVKSFAYAMTPYILKDNPELSANEAINLSCRMMKGRKFDLFYLYLSFIGWWLLCIFTAGIGFLWLIPYVQTAQAAFYDDVRQDYLNRQ